MIDKKIIYFFGEEISRVCSACREVTICAMLSDYMCEFKCENINEQIPEIVLQKKVKGGWVHLTKSDSQEEDQGMICRLVYTYTNYERREGKRRGPRRSLGDLLYIVYGGRCRQTCISNAIGLQLRDLEF